MTPTPEVIQTAAVVAQVADAVGTPNTLLLLSTITALIILGLLAFRQNRPLNLETLAEVAQEATQLGPTMAEAAEVGVGAAQQLRDKGDIDTGGEAFKRAWNHVTYYYPDADPDIIADHIEYAYRLIKPYLPKQVTAPVEAVEASNPLMTTETPTASMPSFGDAEAITAPAERPRLIPRHFPPGTEA